LVENESNYVLPQLFNELWNKYKINSVSYLSLLTMKSKSFQKFKNSVKHNLLYLKDEDIIKD